jgi:hypothetical protein
MVKSWKWWRLIFLCGLVVCNACMKVSDVSGDKPVVTVGDWNLTVKQLNEAIPDNLSSQDSVALADDYISRWIRDRLLLHQAEMNLTEKEKDVDKLLEEYRTSLLVHLYQQKMLQEKHLPEVTDQEIETYYNEMQDNFKLQNNIVQGVFLKIPVGVPNQKDLKKWYRSRAPEDLVNLEAYAFQYARKYDQFIEEWISFGRINSSLPEPINNEEHFLKHNKYYETADSLYNYYFVIYHYLLVGQQAPLSFVEERVRAILLNQKRLEFINHLGDDLYDTALKDKLITFH